MIGFHALHDLRRYTQYRIHVHAHAMHMYAGPLTPRHKCAISYLLSVPLTTLAVGRGACLLQSRGGENPTETSTYPTNNRCASVRGAGTHGLGWSRQPGWDTIAGCGSLQWLPARVMFVLPRWCGRCPTNQTPATASYFHRLQRRGLPLRRRLRVRPERHQA